MSPTTDILGAVKKVFLLSENMARLSTEVEKLSRQVTDHDRRLIRLETIVDMATQTRRIVPPGE